MSFLRKDNMKIKPHFSFTENLQAYLKIQGMSKVGCLHFPPNTSLNPTQTAGDKKKLRHLETPHSLVRFHAQCCANINVSTSRTSLSFPSEALPIHHLYFSSIFLPLAGATSSQMCDITLCDRSISLAVSVVLAVGTAAIVGAFKIKIISR